MSNQNQSAEQWNNLSSSKRSRAIPAKKVLEGVSAQPSVQSSTVPSAQSSTQASTQASTRIEKGTRNISGQSIKIISVETTTGSGSNKDQSDNPNLSRKQTRSSGQPRPAGQAKSAGQPRSTGQPRSNGQPKSAGQPRSNGQPKSAGQATQVRGTSKSGHDGLKSKGKKRPLPGPVYLQTQLRKKFEYKYEVMENGNVLNNSTIYVRTGVAHPHQIEITFQRALDKARQMPDVFGPNFECDIQLNFIRKFDGGYMGYAFVDVDNPAFYYVLIGFNPDGSERAEYVDDPTWVPPSTGTDDDEDFFDQPLDWSSDKPSGLSWDSQVSVTPPVQPPKIRQELKPIISLEPYEYSPDQQRYLDTDETHGTFSISPAFITPGKDDRYDDCSLYVSEVPANDPDFLYALFARYARTSSPREKKQLFFPQITVREAGPEDDSKIFAIVEYSHPYDAAFALHMLQKIRAKYNDQEVVMPVRNAFKAKR